MAHENVRMTYPNFCLGPQTGTMCTVNTSNPTTVLRIKNFAGALVTELSFSSNIVNEVLGLEYVGPPGLTGLIDGLSFFTLERVSSSACVIKRWETRLSRSELDLKEQIIKSDSGDAYYDVYSFAVEYDVRTVRNPNENYSYVDLNDSSGIKTGTKLYLGPSSDTDNLNSAEVATVSHVGQVSDGKRVFLTAPLTYQYVVGDTVTLYRYVYVFSRIGYGNDPNKGALYKFDAYTWNTVEVDSKTIYKNVASARWCPSARSIASIVNSNMLFVRPYESYINWRSFFLDNFVSNKVDTYNVVDVIFDGNTIYRLQDAVTLRDDDGELHTYYWTEYNYQQDTLLPYNNSLAVWMEQSLVTGHTKSIEINANVRDQYFVGLRDVDIHFEKDGGDDDAVFAPLGGNVTTDANGFATIGYVSGFEYYGHTPVRASSLGGSTSKGSVYVWGSNNVISYPDFPDVNYKLFQIDEAESPGYGFLRQINNTFKVIKLDEAGDPEEVDPDITIIGKSYFTSPGGDWLSIDNPNSCNPSIVQSWLPQLYRGDGTHYDAPAKVQGTSSPFTMPNLETANPEVDINICNRITLKEDFVSVASLKEVTVFMIYDSNNGPDPEDGRLPDVIIIQPDESFDLTFSQLKLSKHTHWVDGVAQDELWTYVNLNQFVFVEDAIPVFYSEKNPPDTDIWIRLRPFAYSLDNDSFRMWVREVSYEGDTGFVEVTDDVQLTNFDAGGGLLGIEALYDPPVDFKYNSLIFIRIEVYDEAYISNFIYVEYWFEIVPDYTAPYLTNLFPSREEINVPIDTNISFEIHDVGTGLDLDSLECLLNSRLMDPSYLTITEVSNEHVMVNYTPPQLLGYNKSYRVTVKVQDSSPNQNKTVDSWMFYTAESSDIVFTEFDPGRCKRGMRRFSDVSVAVLAGGSGIDRDSIRMQVFNKDVNHKLIPIVYRIS